MPFQLKVNGQITYPSNLNTSEFESLINITKPNGGNYKLEEPKNLIDSRYYFSFKVSHKVSPSVYPMFKNAIMATWLKKFPEWKNRTINISIGNQEEVVVNGMNRIKEKVKIFCYCRKTAWKLYYSLTVDGKKFFWSDVTDLNLSVLGQETKFKGPNGVGYSIVEYNSSTNVFSSKKMFSIYLNTYTATSDINKIRQKLKHLWQLKLKETFPPSIKAVWKWDYALEINKTRQYREAVPILNINLIKTAIENLTSISGYKFVVLTSSSSYKQYSMHFPVYVSTKVSKDYFMEFKKQLVSTWNSSHTGWLDIKL
ncbi:hypothetical protein KUTeg_016022 [Tegillarca granosa]|uniref:Uncharacterized protein n=1 Tax=Tegillarca granosa TaxID=220873 RepID=A0ABQ9ENH3_TEGGR|nr:hypothetical protein KUTeg_016022 [Tegillarca granosa]